MKIVISYSHYNSLLNKLVDMIKNSNVLNNVEFIYSYMRGGLPIAVHLSHNLDKPVYTNEKAIDFTTISTGSVLIVDDIADTGVTLDGKQFLFPIATLFYKPRSIVKPTFYVEETSDWIVFPWETIDEIPNR